MQINILSSIGFVFDKTKRWKASWKLVAAASDTSLSDIVVRMRRVMATHGADVACIQLALSLSRSSLMELFHVTWYVPAFPET